MAADRDVRVVDVAPQATAVVALVTDWESFAELWAPLLGEVWEALRAAGAAAGRNVMLYNDDRPAVEVGVELHGAFEPAGRVTLSSLPGGTAATTIDPGPPIRDSLRAAHHAVADFCPLRPALVDLQPLERDRGREPHRDLPLTRLSEDRSAAARALLDRDVVAVTDALVVGLLSRSPFAGR